MRRAKFDDAIATLDKCADIDPSDPEGHYKLAMFYWDKAYRDPLLSDVQRKRWLSLRKTRSVCSSM